MAAGDPEGVRRLLQLRVARIGLSVDIERLYQALTLLWVTDKI